MPPAALRRDPPWALRRELCLPGQGTASVMDFTLLLLLSLRLRVRPLREVQGPRPRTSSEWNARHVGLYTARAVVGTDLALFATRQTQGDGLIRTTERGVIPCCTHRKQRSDSAGPALYYLVVNRRSPSVLLHHHLVSGCIASRLPAR